MGLMIKLITPVLKEALNFTSLLLQYGNQTEHTGPRIFLLHNRCCITKHQLVNFNVFNFNVVLLQR